MQTAMVAIAERMFVLDRMLEALVVIIKMQRNTNKLLQSLGRGLGG